jgi:predicted RNA polymerase sigma factor
VSGLSPGGGDRRGAASYERALALARQEPEHRFLAGRIAELKKAELKE